MKKIISAALCLMLIVCVLAGCGSEKETRKALSTSEPTTAPTSVQGESETVSLQTKSTEPLISMSDIPAQDLSKVDANYQNLQPLEGEEVAVIRTNYGDIYLKFFPEAAPIAVANFKALVKAGRYDETLIHRIFHPYTSGISGIQGGDYTQYNGYGGVSAFGESFGLELCDYLSNTRGSVAMANTGQPNSNGSQFYINQDDNSVLDGGYTIFAQVYSGLDVVDAIYAVETDANDRPLTQVIVRSIEIFNY